VAEAELKENRPFNLNKDGWCCTTFTFAGENNNKNSRDTHAFALVILPSDGLRRFMILY
jgi:hypothetical protein